MRFRLLALFFPALLAACNDPEVPSGPPELTPPPDVATKGFLTAYVEETVPMSIIELRAFIAEEPLISFLQPTENISNPVASEVLQGNWPDPGAIRWLRLDDGHYVIERVIENAPAFFKYQVFIFTNSTGRGVEQIVGEQRFVPVEDGTRFEWSYNVLPRNMIARQIVRRNMPEIEAYITGGLLSFAAAARAAKASQ
ncbi:MAG: SRPBCC family protein [Pseudomonadota bacterium]